MRRVEEAEDIACDGIDSCRRCKAVVEALRDGSIWCPDCKHVNAIGHSCEDWREFDAGRMTAVELDARMKARMAAGS